MTGLDMCDPTSELRLEAPASASVSGSPEPGRAVIQTPRIGIGYADEPWKSRPWRYLLSGEPAVSGPPSPRGSGRRPDPLEPGR